MRGGAGSEALLWFLILGIGAAGALTLGAIFCTLGNSFTGTGFPTTLNVVVPFLTNMTGPPELATAAAAGEVMGPGTAVVVVVVVVEAAVGFTVAAVAPCDAMVCRDMEALGFVHCCLTTMGWLMPGILNTIGCGARGSAGLRTIVWGMLADTSGVTDGTTEVGNVVFAVEAA